MHTVIPKHLLNKQLIALLEGETNIIANLSNASALLYEHFDIVNWAGFYLWDKNDEQLVLGPFQGKVACVRINNGEGVCGAAFQNQETFMVPNVHEFPGHIACDSASESEIVVPLIKDGKAIGVLDIDSPVQNRFLEEDRQVLEEFARILVNYI